MDWLSQHVLMIAYLQRLADYDLLELKFYSNEGRLKLRAWASVLIVVYNMDHPNNMWFGLTTLMMIMLHMWLLGQGIFVATFVRYI